MEIPSAEEHNSSPIKMEMEGEVHVGEPSNRAPQAPAPAVSDTERLRLEREEVQKRYMREAMVAIREDALPAPTPLAKTGLAILLVDYGLMNDEGRQSCGTWTAAEMVEKMSAFRTGEAVESAVCLADGKFSQLRRKVIHMLVASLSSFGLGLCFSFGLCFCAYHCSCTAASGDVHS
jgi:hypothetical protein